jgi:hypothetical protein
MKFKLKHLAAAAALVAASPAFAYLSGPDDGGGELILSVWQAAGTGTGTVSASYSLDLGVTYQQLLDNQSVNLYINQVISDTYFSQLLAVANTSLLQFSVLTGDRTDHPYPNEQLLSTFAGSVALPQYNNILDSALDQVANYVGALQASGNIFAATNGSSFNTTGDAYYATNDLNTLTGQSSPNSGLIGTSLKVVDVVGVAGACGPLCVPTKTTLPGVFTFAQSGGTYTLQYQVAAVPEPSGLALALAGFGVVGFIARRRKIG